MKKFIAVALALVLSTSLVYAKPNDLELDVVKSLGIMNGNENGDLMLDKNVTRAEFAKMAADVSKYHENVSGRAYVSLFSDVKSEHWASAYIKLAVDKKWFAGYVDGTFRPENIIKYEEGIAVALRIMGYDFSEATGVYPNVQLDKAREIGLLKNLAGTRGSNLSRKQCKTLFYNMLVCSNAKGSTEGAAASHVRTVAVKNGEVDYLSLVYDELDGPFIYNGNEKMLPMNAKIFKAGRSISNLNNFDVYYENKALGQVFVFDQKALGRIDKILPNTINPEKVVINGKEYALSGYEAKVQFSPLGGYKTGDSVVALLGLGGDNVVGVTGSADVNMTYYGILLGKESGSTEINSKKVYYTDIKLMCTDGQERSFRMDYKTSIEDGNFVKIRLTEKGADLSSMPKRSLYGKITKNGIDDKDFAPNVSFQEYYDHAAEGEWLKNITLSDVLNAKVSSDNVVFYDTDDSGDITNIIFNNITGNARKYGLLYAIHREEDGGDMSVHTGSYTCFFNGDSQVISTSGFNKAIPLGVGVEVYSSLEGSDLIKELDKIKIHGIEGNVASSPDGDIKIASNVQIYLKDDGKYRLINKENLEDGDYKLMAYYNKASVGKRIRVIVAKEKKEN